jgi:hypothetical protein
MKMRSVLPLVVLGLASFFGGCSKPPAAHSPPPAEITFYWTSEAHGRLEPCGCFSGQHGGLTRISAFLQSPGAARRPLLADIGNAITGTADYQVIQYRYMQQAFASMQYAALNMGEREAQLPAEALKKIRDASAAPMISANLIERAGGQRIFPAYRIVEERGWRVAFVGALGETPEENLGAGLAVESMKSALAKVLPEVKKQADVIVLLAFADEAAMRALADEFYELDVILGGKVKESSQKLTRQNRSVVLWTTNEAKALGMFKAEVAGRGKLAAKDFDILFIHDKIPQDEKLAQLAQDYRDEIRKTPLAVDDPTHAREDEVPGVKSASGYAGSESCAACHAKAYEVWERTGHSHAFQSLVGRKSDADPNCIGCHTVGFGTKTGYRREWQGRAFANVGCENCHGPGREHVSERQRLQEQVQVPGLAMGAQKALFTFRPAGASDCVACHYGEFSRPFEFESFWREIKHSKEPVKPKPGPFIKENVPRPPGKTINP